jgi:hypothetical protein
MLKVLLETAHWLIEANPDQRVVWLRRSSAPFSAIPELTNANQRVIQSLGRDRAGWGIIVDMRRAPPRNDPVFEQAMRALREAVESRFSRTALLLSTQAGVLQVQRLGREDGATSFATTNESTALAHARGALADPQRRMSSRPAPSSRGSVPPGRGGAAR